MLERLFFACPPEFVDGEHKKEGRFRARVCANIYNQRLVAVEESEVVRLPKRNRFEIFAEMLETAKDGAKKTRISYRCNLSHLQAKKFLSDLLETGLLRVGNSYHTTEKGLQFLEVYHDLELLLNARN